MAGFGKLKIFGAVLSAISLVGCVSYSEPTTNFTGEYLAGRLAARMKDHQTAAEQFSRVQAVAPSSLELRKETFMFSLLTGEVDQAALVAKSLARTATHENSDLLVPLTLAVTDIRKGRYASARTELDKLKDGSVYESGAFLLRAWALAGDRGTQEAIKHLKNPPEKLFTGFNPLHIAFLSEKAGRIEDARASYQLAFVTLGGPVGQRALMAFLERQGDAATLREASNILNRRQGGTRRLAQQTLRRLEKNAVSSEFSDVSPAKGSAIALYTLAAAMTEQIYNQRDAAADAGFTLRDPNLDQPLALTQLALALDPSLPEANRFLGSLTNIYGQYDVAANALSRIEPSSPLYEQARIEIAGALVAQEKTGQAIDVLNKLIKRDPDANEARLVLASTYAREENHESAVAILGPAIDTFSDNPPVDSWRYYVSRADALLQLDRWQEAEADLKRSVEIAPEEPSALNYLGYSWAERGVNLTEAFELLEKAREKEPRSGAITDSVGWAHYQLGDYSEAIVNLEKAVSLEPDDPTITDHLGDAYWQLGRKIEARYEWRRALDLDPPKSLKTSLESKLTNGLEDIKSAPAPQIEAQ